jgi:comEA protein
LGIIGCFALAGGVAWWYPVSHTWLSVQLGLSGPGTYAVAASAPTAALADRVASLEQKVADAQAAVANDTAEMTSLQNDFQEATKEVAASNVALQNQSAQIQVLTEQLKGSIPSSTVDASSGSSDTTNSINAKVSINTGTEAQLDSLPGIGPTYAQRIIDYRTQHGPFANINDLTNVSGIGPATFDKIKDLIEL